MQRLRLTGPRLAFGIAIFLSILRFNGCALLDIVDSRTVDYRLRQRGVMPPSNDVIIVAIDNESIEAIGRWPWSRSVRARLVDKITAGGAAVVGFDIIDSEETYDVATLPDQVPEVNEEAWRRIREILVGDDQMLVDAVRKSERAVLGYFFEFGETPNPRDGAFSEYPAVKMKDPRGLKVLELRQPSSVKVNLAPLTTVARETGFFNIFSDLDGVVRRFPMVIYWRDRFALPLALSMLKVYRNDQPSIRIEEFGVAGVRFGDTEIPVGEDGQLLLNYRGPGKTFTHVSAADVLSGSLSPDVLRNKLVLVGLTATAWYDLRVTPFDADCPGVEVHATVIDNILRNDFIWQPKVVVVAEIAAILAFAVVLGAVMHYFRGLAGALTSIFLLTLYLFGSQWIFTVYRIPLSLVYPTLAIGVTYAAILLEQYIVEEREKRKMRNVLDLHLSPSVARFVSSKPEMMTLGGDKKDLSVMFSDIRGFTSLTELYDPTKLVEILNQYFSRMTDVVFDREGTLDKYMGDGIMAVWGAPVPLEKHATLACLAALEMTGALEQLNERWDALGIPVMDIGIGIATGEMIVGNMGSTRRLSYTVIGDNVNLGARLEGLCKTYGCRIIVSEQTAIESQMDVVTRELDLVRVKGKARPVRIYEVLAVAAERDTYEELVRLFTDGLVAYRAQRWSEAIAAFGNVLDIRPQDGPARLFIERCAVLGASTLPEDWDGVAVMESK